MNLTETQTRARQESFDFMSIWQWGNRRGAGVFGGAGGAECPPETSDREIFADVLGKKRQRKKGKRGENWEEKVENWKWKQENVRKRVEDLFFFFFFLLFTFEND